LLELPDPVPEPPLELLPQPAATNPNTAATTASCNGRRDPLLDLLLHMVLSSQTRDVNRRALTGP
jgi:endonuclease III